MQAVSSHASLWRNLLSGLHRFDQKAATGVEKSQYC
jgi:hypothetical protein